MTRAANHSNALDKDMIRIAEKWSLGDTITQGAIQAALVEYRNVRSVRRISSATRRQREALKFIKEYSELHGYAPSYEEIKDGLGLASKSGVARLISGLLERDLISMVPDRARSIAVK